MPFHKQRCPPSLASPDSISSSCTPRRAGLKGILTALLFNGGRWPVEPAWSGVFSSSPICSYFWAFWSPQDTLQCGQWPDSFIPIPLNCGGSFLESPQPQQDPGVRKFTRNSCCPVLGLGGFFLILLTIFYLAMEVKVGFKGEPNGLTLGLDGKDVFFPC